MSNKKYIEQYERMKRWYNRFEKINNGRIHNNNSDYYEDEVYVFFQNCYCLKDWIKKINKESFHDVEKLFDKEEGSSYMKICADISNGSKHMAASINTRIDKDLDLSSKKIELTVQEGKSPVINCHYKIKANEKCYDAFEVAENCVKEWEKYLKLKKVIK